MYLCLGPFWLDVSWYLGYDGVCSCRVLAVLELWDDLGEIARVAPPGEYKLRGCDIITAAVLKSMHLRLMLGPLTRVGTVPTRSCKKLFALFGNCL